MQAGRPAGILAGRLAGRLAARLAGRLAARFATRLAGRVAGMLGLVHERPNYSGAAHVVGAVLKGLRLSTGFRAQAKTPAQPAKLHVRHPGVHPHSRSMSCAMRMRWIPHRGRKPSVGGLRMRLRRRPSS